jgi:hypothetical protein
VVTTQPIHPRINEGPGALDDEPAPPAPCCGTVCPNKTYPVFWNEWNQAVQCHVCGHTYTPAPKPGAILPAESEARHTVQTALREALPSPYPADVRALLALVDDYLAVSESAQGDPDGRLLPIPRKLVARMHAYLTQGLPTLDDYEALVEHAASTIHLAEDAHDALRVELGPNPGVTS